VRLVKFVKGRERSEAHVCLGFSRCARPAPDVQLWVELWVPGWNSTSCATELTMRCTRTPSVRPAWRGETEGAGGALFCIQFFFAVVAMHRSSCVNTEVSPCSPATQTPRSLLAESTRCHRLRKQGTRITGTRLRDLERNWQLSRARECGVHTKDTHKTSSIHARQVVHGS
jgi:hypothetical protein